MVRGTKQKRGDLVSVDIGDGTYFYALALTHPLFAFFDRVFAHGETVHDVRDLSVLFKICVMDRAAKSGRWAVIGKVDPAIVAALDGTVFFKQDLISGKITAYDPVADSESSLTFEEADHLEAAAVWDPEHVEDRLRDHISGVTNKWWASLRPRK